MKIKPELVKSKKHNMQEHTSPVCTRLYDCYLIVLCFVQLNLTSSSAAPYTQSLKYFNWRHCVYKM